VANGSAAGKAVKIKRDRKMKNDRVGEIGRLAMKRPKATSPRHCGNADDYCIVTLFPQTEHTRRTLL
jgi:hypothetical protein